MGLFTVHLSIIYINYIHGWDFQFSSQHTQCNEVFSRDLVWSYNPTFQTLSLLRQTEFCYVCLMNTYDILTQDLCVERLNELSDTLTELITHLPFNHKHQAMRHSYNTTGKQTARQCGNSPVIQLSDWSIMTQKNVQAPKAEPWNYFWRLGGRLFDHAS